nr:UDP-N-acetylglucosamine 2-epimerase (non-hydrolyzing) [uncultured Prevotella sp.]
MKKILLTFGTRPEAIKMAPLILELKKHSDKIETIVCVTGQHREMLDQVLSIFKIKPDYDLNIMKKGQDLYDITSNVLLGLRDVLKQTQPDLVLVHGDTTTSMTAALAAYYQQIPVGHIEAGLRTNNIYSPWPEEINRQLIGRISNYNFAPTPNSSTNLIKEGVEEASIYITGNTVIDSLFWVVNKIKSDELLNIKLKEEIRTFGYDIDRLQKNRRMVLITGHRRENLGEGFIHIAQAIQELSTQFPNVDFVYPMHLNPNVRKSIYEVLGNDLSHFSNMFFIEPLEYLSFIYMMEKADIVLTDSGGIQEEAPSLKKPVLVMRDTTERPEAVEAGTVILIGTDKEKIVYNVNKLLKDKTHYQQMAKAINPYGDGKACERIANILLNI